MQVIGVYFLSSRVLAWVFVKRKSVRPTIFSEWWGGTGKLVDSRKEMGNRGGKWRIRNTETVS